MNALHLYLLIVLLALLSLLIILSQSPELDNLPLLMPVR